MASVRTSYRLKRFQSSRDPDFAAALIMYVRNTPAAVRTDTNEIAYWLDEFTARFGDVFYAFGFYRDRELVGYAEAAYLRADRLLAFDYLVIDEAHRRNNIFYEFVDHLKTYLENAHPEYRYAVAEVCYGPGQQYPSQESCLLTRLLKMQGFRVIRAPYYQPRLILEDAESEMKADLLIYSTATVDRIHAETYLSIVRAIYYDYYFRWKSIVPETVDAYRRHIDRLYSLIQSRIGRKKSVLVNGHKATLTAAPRKSFLTLHRIIVFSIQAAGVIILLTAAMLGLKYAFRLSDATFATIYGLAILSFIGLAGIVSKNAREIFRELLSFGKLLFLRRISPTPIHMKSESGGGHERGNRGREPGGNETGSTDQN